MAMTLTSYSAGQDATMTRTASIAEARNHLPALVHSAEEGQPIALTRRGRAVAVLLSMADYERLQRGGSGDFSQAIELFRAARDMAGLDLGAAFENVRDSSQGREVQW